METAGNKIKKTGKVKAENQTLSFFTVGCSPVSCGLALKTGGEKMYGWKYVLAVTVFTIFVALIYSMVFAFQTEASYYTVESCMKESGQAIMANGKELKDDMLITASWDFPFGTLLRITNLANNKSVIVTVSDRGPNRRLYRKGRKIDLSYEAMRRLDGIKRGLIQVEVEVVK